MKNFEKISTNFQKNLKKFEKNSTQIQKKCQENFRKIGSGLLNDLWTPLPKILCTQKWPKMKNSILELAPKASPRS